MIELLQSHFSPTEIFGAVAVVSLLLIWGGIRNIAKAASVLGQKSANAPVNKTQLDTADKIIPFTGLTKAQKKHVKVTVHKQGNHSFSQIDGVV